jgi:hypothetical protein
MGVGMPIFSAAASIVCLTVSAAFTGTSDKPAAMPAMPSATALKRFFMASLAVSIGLMLESTAPSGLRAAGVGFAMLREAGNACGGGISESTSMKEHLSVFFKKLQGERGVKS